MTVDVDNEDLRGGRLDHVSAVRVSDCNYSYAGTSSDTGDWRWRGEKAGTGGALEDEPSRSGKTMGRNSVSGAINWSQEMW